MLTALLTIASLYFIFLLLLRTGWKMALQTRTRVSFERPLSVTVIVPARNETPHIANLLRDLERQTIQNFEVIVVDDHSEDDTPAVAQTFCGNPNYHLEIFSMDGSAGKKAAITAGVHRARGTVIVTTDADCRVGPQWIESITGSFERHVKFVSAGVRIGPATSFRARLQAAEFASLIAVGVSAIGLERPVMCNGANMAFTRDVFLEVGGYVGNEHIPSGDDVFLLQKIHQRHPGSVVFCPRSGAVVETAATSWRNFIDQRVRWGGKWKHATALTTPALALFVGMVHLSWLFLVPAVVLKGALVEPAILLVAKALLEMLYLRPVHRFLGQKWSWAVFVLLQLTYSVYFVIVGILANVKTTVWKGRKIRLRPTEIHS